MMEVKKRWEVEMKKEERKKNYDSWSLLSLSSLYLPKLHPI